MDELFVIIFTFGALLKKYINESVFYFALNVS